MHELAFKRKIIYISQNGSLTSARVPVITAKKIDFLGWIKEGFYCMELESNNPLVIKLEQDKKGSQCNRAKIYTIEYKVKNGRSRYYYIRLSIRALRLLGLPSHVIVKISKNRIRLIPLHEP